MSLPLILPILPKSGEARAPLPVLLLIFVVVLLFPLFRGCLRREFSFQRSERFASDFKIILFEEVCSENLILNRQCHEERPLHHSDSVRISKATRPWYQAWNSGGIPSPRPLGSPPPSPVKNIRMGGRGASSISWPHAAFFKHNQLAFIEVSRAREAAVQASARVAWRCRASSCR